MEDVIEFIGVEVKIDMLDWGGWVDLCDNGMFLVIIYWLEDSGMVYGFYILIMDLCWILFEGKVGFNFGCFDDLVVIEVLNIYVNVLLDEECIVVFDI